MNGVRAYRLYRRVRARAFTELVRRDFAELGPGVTICPPFEVYGEEQIAFVGGTFVGPGSRVFAWRPDGRIRVEARARLTGNNMITAAAPMRIGDGAEIARGVYITDHDHAFDEPSVAIRDQGIGTVRPVDIGDGAWLGQNACILKASVGAGAIVAAGAVVTRDVAPRAIVAGVPARQIGTR